MMNARIKGLLIGTAAAATYGLNPLFALPLYADGLDTYSVLLLRYLGAIPLLAIMIKARGRSFAIRRDQIVPVIILGLMLGLSSLGLFLSYRYIDAGIASTLLFVYPLMVALIMAALYHEKLTMQTVVCLLTALAGIFMLSHTAAGAAISAIGVFWVVVSALSYAVYIVIINRSRVNDMPTLPLTFWLLIFGSVIFIGGVAMQGELILPSRPLLWLNTFALALLPTVVSLSLTTVAIHMIGPTPTAILGVFEPVTAVVVGVAVFGEELGARQIVGLILILGAVTMVVSGGNLAAQIVRIKKMFPPLRSRRKK